MSSPKNQRLIEKRNDKNAARIIELTKSTFGIFQSLIKKNNLILKKYNIYKACGLLPDKKCYLDLLKFIMNKKEDFGYPKSPFYLHAIFRLQVSHLRSAVYF
ncbi:MAG: hypothetical protein CL710_05245 [Chloroflexi bacterium]|nr:hypothetical protein [Chloroflexota bacterium]